MLSGMGPSAQGRLSLKGHLMSILGSTGHVYSLLPILTTPLPLFFFFNNLLKTEKPFSAQVSSKFSPGPTVAKPFSGEFFVRGTQALNWVTCKVVWALGP